MSSPIFSVALLLTLTACGSKPVVEDKVAEAKTDDRIECAVDGGSFSKMCTIERGADDGLILRHEGGGFRKVTLEGDGTIDTADGAEAISVTPLSDGRTEIAIDGDRYRLPAGL